MLKYSNFIEYKNINGTFEYNFKMQKMEKLTHIRLMGENNYIGEWDLPIENNGEKTVKIVKIEMGEVVGNGNKKSQKPLIYFAEFKKPLVLNSENRKAITTALESPYIEHWINKSITLFRLKKLRAFGQEMDAIRVRNFAPAVKTLPEFNELHPKYNIALESIKKGETTLEMLKQHFTISDIIIQKINYYVAGNKTV